MLDVIRSDIRQLTAYQVPDARGLIKLDAMENPYSLPAALRAGWLAALEHTELNRYPDPQARTLCEVLRQTMAIPEHCGLLLGNGSDELIQILALAVTGANQRLLAFEPGFVMYRLIAQLTGLEYIGVTLTADAFALDLDRALEAITRQHPALTFIAYPNNPTGNLFDPQGIEKIIEAAAPGLVVFDEAYAPFANASFMPYLETAPNLLILRTVSKMGLAGLRLGYLVGAAECIDELNKVRLPYNINVLTQHSATFALRHQAIFNQQTEQICSERQRLIAAFNAIAHIHCYPSAANFLLLRLSNAPAVFDHLKQQGILVKNLHGSHPLLNNCLRITVGTPEDNTALINVLFQC